MDPKELRGLQESYLEIYSSKEEIQESKKWIQQAIKKPGALHKQLGVPAGEKIPSKKLEVAAKKGGKLGKRARLAQTLSGFHEEQVDIYDTILEYLVSKGYADTNESALVIMANMSEEWRQSIMERGDEPGEEDWRPDVKRHNKSLKDKYGKPRYPSGKAGYPRRPSVENDPRYGSM